MEPLGYLLIYFVVMYVLIARAVHAGAGTALVARHLKAQTALLLQIARRQGVPEPELAAIESSTQPPARPPGKPAAAPPAA